MLNDAEIESLQQGAFAAVTSDVAGGGSFISGVSAAIDAPEGLVASSSNFGEFNNSATANTQVIKRGEAPVVDFATGVGGFALNWGVWEASESQPASLFTDFADSSQVTQITTPVVLVNPTPTEISSLTGKKKFTTATDFLLRAQGFADNTIGSVTGGFVIDFASAAFSEGKIDICIGASSCAATSLGVNFWPIRFAGNLLQPGAIGDASSDIAGIAQINTQGAGVFLGSGAEGFVLSFTSTGSGADTASKGVSGAVLFGDPVAVSSNLLLTNEELATLTNNGFALFTPASSGSLPSSALDGFLFGGAAPASSAKPIFTSSAQTRVGGILPATFEVLFRDSATVSSLVDNVGGLELSWGIWESSAGASATRFPDVTDSSVSEEALGPVLFATGTPVNITQVASAGRFHISEHLLSGANIGQQSVVRGSFLLDVANATINDLRVQFCLGADTCAGA